MNISSVLQLENIILDVESVNKKDLINELASKLNQNGYLNDIEQFKKDIWERENQVSTEVGYGVAIPHAKSEAVKNQP